MLIVKKLSAISVDIICNQTIEQLHMTRLPRGHSKQVIGLLR